MILFKKNLLVASLLFISLLGFLAPLSAMNRKLFLLSKISPTEAEAEKDLILLKDSVFNGQKIDEAVEKASDLYLRNSESIYLHQAILPLLQELIKKERVQNDKKLYSFVRSMAYKLSKSKDPGVQAESSTLLKNILMSTFKSFELTVLRANVYQGREICEAAKAACELCESNFIVVQQGVVALLQELVRVLLCMQENYPINPAFYIYIEGSLNKLSGSEYAGVRADALGVLQNMQGLRQQPGVQLIVQRIVNFMDPTSGGLLNLKGLNLCSEDLSLILDGIGRANCAKIRELWLNNNDLAELNPEIFADLIQLQVLDFAGNQLSPQTEEALERSLTNVYFYFYSNR